MLQHSLEINLKMLRLQFDFVLFEGLGLLTGMPASSNSIKELTSPQRAALRKRLTRSSSISMKEIVKTGTIFCTPLHACTGSRLHQALRFQWTGWLQCNGVLSYHPHFNYIQNLCLATFV